MIKKIIAYILTVSMLLSMAVVNVHAEEVSAERVTRFENAVALLTSLGAISENETYTFETEITRGQFVDILSKIIPVSEGSTEPAFADVDATHKYFKVIQGFADAGYINGHAGNYEPDRAITYHEALYILLNTMGYADFMKLVANYAAGGMQIADRLDIDTKNKGAVAGDIFYLTYQALSTDMLAITGMKEGSFIFETDPEKSLLETYHNIEVDTGILQANGQVSINGQFSAEDGIVVVTDVAYKMDKNCSVLPGCEVDIFYDLDTKEAVCVVATEENEIIEINSADIDGFKNMRYDYKKNGASKTLRVRSGADIVINNVLATEIDEKAMVPDNGKIIAIDNGETTGYAVIYVKNYISFVAKSVVDGINKVTIYPAPDSGIKNVIANVEVDEPIVYDIDGSVASISDITLGTVVSVLGTENGAGEIVADEIVMSNGIVSGDLMSISRRDPITLDIDGVQYPLAATSEYILNGLRPQGNMTFLVDFMGNIVALDAEISGGMAYGYILGAKLAYNDEGEKVVSVKLLSEIGSIITYYLSPERVYLDDEKSDKYYNPEDVLSKFTSKINKLIRYDVNENREINKVDFAVSIESKGTPTINNRLFTSHPATDLYYRKTYKTFSTKVMVDENTVVFKVPERPEDALPSDYQVIRDVTKISDGRYNVEAYKVGNETMVASVIVLKQNLNTYSDSAPYFVVKEVTQVLDQYEDVTYSVLLDGQSGEKTYTVKSASVVEKPHKEGNMNDVYREIRSGDIIRCLIDATGTIIEDITICFQAEEGLAISTSGIGSYDWNDSARVISGEVYAMNDTLLSIVADGTLANADPAVVLSDSASEKYMLDSFKIFKLEVTGMGVEVSTGSKNDIKAFRTSGGEYSRVVAITGSATGKVLFVIE